MSSIRPRTVDNLRFEETLEVPHLVGTERFVKDNQVGAFEQDVLANLVRLPFADEKCRVRLVAMLNDFPDDPPTGSLRQLPQLVEGLQTNQYRVFHYSASADPCMGKGTLCPSCLRAQTAEPRFQSVFSGAGSGSRRGPCERGGGPPKREVVTVEIACLKMSCSW